MKDLFLVLIITLFLLTSCATIEETKVHSPPASPANTKNQIKVENNQRGLKRKVAISRFSNETRSGQSFFLDANNDRIGKQAMDILSSKLFETGKFIMLERADLQQIQQELALGDSPTLKNSADYLIVGSITGFGRKEHSDVGVFSRVKKQEAFAKVHIRIIDTYTSQIIYSEEGEGTAYNEAGTVMGVGGKAGYDSQLSDKAIDAAISDLASNIIENLLDKPWRGYILGYEEGNLITSGGKSQNISTGDTFDVFREGKQVKNPQTNMMITLPGKKLASIEIVTPLGDTPESEISLATVSSGSLSEYISKKDFSTLYIQAQKER